MLPTKFEINDYAIMEEFICGLENKQIQNGLFNAIRGKGAFRKFKDQSLRLGLINDWYDFRDREYKKNSKKMVLNK